MHRIKCSADFAVPPSVLTPWWWETFDLSIVFPFPTVAVSSMCIEPWAFLMNYTYYSCRQACVTTANEKRLRWNGDRQTMCNHVQSFGHWRGLAIIITTEPIGQSPSTSNKIPSQPWRMILFYFILYFFFFFSNSKCPKEASEEAKCRLITPSTWSLLPDQTPLLCSSLQYHPNPSKSIQIQTNPNNAGHA